MNQPQNRLRHEVPGWVSDGAVFHIRIRIDKNFSCSLIGPATAPAVLNSVRFYEESGRWYNHVFLLMPDHLHALLSFPLEMSMSKSISAWKAYHTRHTAIAWQANYFDHRIRNASEFDLKAEYIRNNPVVKGLCNTAAEWPWTIDAARGNNVQPSPQGRVDPP